ncbi:hypothetical protein OH77DRAFT_722694 [Trametes cingulata]|nr:hypothetical protein OH77DRAFT_722694 [Trametes cingulata]
MTYSRCPGDKSLKPISRALGGSVSVSYGQAPAPAAVSISWRCTTTSESISCAFCTCYPYFQLLISAFPRAAAWSVPRQSKGSGGYECGMLDACPACRPAPPPTPRTKYNAAAAPLASSCICLIGSYAGHGPGAWGTVLCKLALRDHAHRSRIVSGIWEGTYGARLGSLRSLANVATDPDALQ